MPDAVPILSVNDFQRDTGARLRKLIDLLDMPYTEAAALMGVSKHVLRNWMTGDNPIGSYGLYRLCRAKGVDFNFVFLNDWSSLPTKLGRQLDEELAAGLAGRAAPERPVPEKA